MPIHDGCPIFWLNDPIHLVECIRNNFLTAKELTYVPPNSEKVRVARWKDLSDLYEFEARCSKTIKQSRLNNISVDPPVIARQRVDLALRVFCRETAAALQCFHRTGTAEFVALVANYFIIMNTKSPTAAKRLRDPLREPITSTDTPALNSLKGFSSMIEGMKPLHAKRKSTDRTLTTETARNLVNSVQGFCSMTDYLLTKGYSYVLLGRYTSDHIEKLFGAKLLEQIISYPLLKLSTLIGYNGPE